MKQGSVISLSLILLLAGATMAIAQEGGGNEDALQPQTQLQTQQHAQNQNDGETESQERLQQRFEQRINANENCDEATREQMRQNLRTCLQIGLQEDDLKALFDQGEGTAQLQPKTMIRLQSRVMAAAAGDLPPEPLMAKVREGRLKGVSDEALETVVEKVGENLETAQRVMNQARQRGLEDGTPAQNRETIRTMTRAVWQGVDEEDCEQLLNRACNRRSGDEIHVDDLASAAETVGQLVNKGMDNGRAVAAMGDALGLGYRAGHMRQIRMMFMGGDDGDVDETMKALEGSLAEGEDPQQFQHQWRHMWNYGEGYGDGAGGGGGLGGSHGGDIGGGPGGQGGNGDHDNTGGNDSTGGGNGGNGGAGGNGGGNGGGGK